MYNSSISLILLLILFEQTFKSFYAYNKQYLQLDNSNQNYENSNRETGLNFQEIRMSQIFIIIPKRKEMIRGDTTSI